MMAQGAYQNAAPTDITLSNATVFEDLAVGLSVGTLSTTDPDAGDTFTYSITVDADGKFAISGDQLTVGVALDYETKTSHAVTVRATDAGGLTFDKEFTVTVTDVDETTETDPPIETITPIFEGTFDVDPVVIKHNGKPKVQGKASSIASIILDIGALVAGATYIAQYDPDFSLLSNTGKEAMVGFGLKSGNSFHITGLKGDGSTGLNQAKVYGNWNGLAGATVVSSVSATNGTQAGANWLKIEVSADGTTYTLSTSANGTDWDAEYTAASPDPLTNADDATTFGIAIFFPATDIGQFSMTLDVWTVTLVKTLTYATSASDTVDRSAYTFADTAIGSASADRRVHVAVTVHGVTVTSLTVGGVAATQTSLQQRGTGNAYTFILLVASGTTADIVVNLSGSAGRCAIGVWASTGLTSNTPVDTGGASASGAGTADVITTVDGGFLIAACIGATATPSQTPSWTNATLRWAISQETSYSSGGADAATSAPNLTVTGRANGAANTNTCWTAASF